MLELLFLLLPVAAGYGWYMGRSSVRESTQLQKNKLSRDYVTGLNFLLSDQPDKAVDLFIDMLQVDSETIETHLALGNLFRQRGEVDRAIRIHQNLIARPSLTSAQKDLALTQLAKDYMAAGLFDRAENLFSQLVDVPEHRSLALRQLMTIYQQTREWEKAIPVAEKLRKLGDKTARSCAHFYCELANEQKDKITEKKRIHYFKKALNLDPKCVRANQQLAQLYAERGEHRQAIQYYEAILEQDRDFTSEILAELNASYEACHDAAGYRSFLEKAVSARAGATATIELSYLIEDGEGVDAAQRFVTAELYRNPSMKGFHHLFRYHIDNAEEGGAKASLTVLRRLVGEQLKVKPHYRCQHCGFSSKRIYWQCPSCKSWGKVKPIRGLDGE